MSDSSSEDDEPLMKSPCESESDSDGDHNLFRYDRRRFMKSPMKPTPENLASPARSQRKRSKPTTDDQMSLLEKRQEKKQKNLLARIDRTNVLNDDSDESVDDENRNNRGSDADADSSIEILDDPGVISGTLAASQSDNIIDLPDSSDEDDNVATIRPRIPASDPLLERSRLARQQLTLAQLYHAEDVDVDTREMEAIVPLSVVKARLEQDKDKGIVEDLGETLQLTCMIKQEINGRSHAIVKRQYSIKQNESIQKFVSKILLANSLPSSSRVKVTFDGVFLEKRRTPAFYDMVDEDQVDVDIAANIAPKLSDDRNKNVYGQNVNLKLRRRVGKKVEEIQMRIGLREPFQHLVDTYRRQQNLMHVCITLNFDGEKLDLSKTPQAYGMESGELVDVNCNGGSKAS